MGVKVLQCFPWSRHSKDKGKGRKCVSQTAAPAEVKPHPPATPSCSSEEEVRGSSREVRPVYFTNKACITLRHRLDSNVIDATY